MLSKAPSHVQFARPNERVGQWQAPARTALCLMIAASSFAGLMGPATAAPASGWAPPVLVSPDLGGTGFYARLAADGGGNVTAIWPQVGGGLYSIRANRYVPGEGWGLPTFVDNNAFYDAVQPTIAAGADGNATAVWAESDGAVLSIWASHFDRSTGWGKPVLLESDNTGDARDSSVAMDGAGHAVSVWRQWTGARYDGFANYYSPGLGWGTARLFEQQDAGWVQEPHVAMDSQGNAVVVWSASNGTVSSIWANRFVSGTGWLTEQIIDGDDGADALDPSVSMDSAGNAFATWPQSISGSSHAMASRESAAGVWSVPVAVDTNTLYGVSAPRVSANGAGEAVATWVQGAAVGDEVWAARYVPGSGWGVALKVEHDESGTSQNPAVALDAAGEATIIWDYNDGYRYSAVAARGTAQGGWGVPMLLESDGAGDVTAAAVVALGSGGALAAWDEQIESNHREWSVLYTAPDVTPPALTVTSPADGALANVSTVWVSGVSEVGATVSVNGLAAAVGKGGAFAVEVALAPGGNSLTVVASDASGNSATLTRAVTFLDPVGPALAAAEANASAAKASAAAAEANATDAAGHFAAAQAALERAQREIDEGVNFTAERNLTIASLSTELALTRAQLNETRTQVASSAAPKADSLPLILALVGVALGGAALAMSFMRPAGGGSGGGGGGSEGGRLAVSPGGALTRVEPPKDAGGTPEFQGGRIP